MDINDYKKNRLEDQIQWYDKKSKKAKKCFHLSRILIILTSASIPIISYFLIADTWTKVIIICVSVFITATESINNLMKFNEHWIEYRTISETLKKEKYMYENKAGIYNDTNNDFPYFVERIESIISQENVNWASLNNTNNKKEKRE